MKNLNLKNIKNIYFNSIIFKRIESSNKADWYGQIAIGVIFWITLATILYSVVDKLI